MSEYIENPKTVGSNIVTCKPQKGKCPIDCNQCFANRDGSYITGFHSNIPSTEEVSDRIVRVNDLNDSNIQRTLVIETARQYKDYFFNTSLPNNDFPGPVVLTVNPKEEDCGIFPDQFDKPLDNIMFVRVRISPANLNLVDLLIDSWVNTERIPVVLTFMSYYNQLPPGTSVKEIHSSQYFLNEELIPENHRELQEEPVYEWKIRHINQYWCPTNVFKKYVLHKMNKVGGRLVTMCGTLQSDYCRDCKNCEIYYWQTKKRLEQIKYE